MSAPPNLPASGTPVHFVGGTGRGEDANVVQSGIVNGSPIIVGGGAYVPVYMPRTDQCVVVWAENLRD